MNSHVFGSFDERRNVFEDTLTNTFEALLLIFFGSLAISTLTLKLGVIFDVSFLNWARTTLITTVIIAIPVIVKVKPFNRASNHIKTDWVLIAIALILTIAGATLAILINRPDLDDSVYVPKALYYTENPTQILNTTVTSIFNNGKAINRGVLPSYELFQASFSELFGGHFLLYYHIIFPALVGALIVISIFLLASILHPSRRSVLFGILVFILVSNLLGETHRAYGNLSFARAFHAKYMFLTVGVTSWVYFSLKYFILRDWLSWLALLLIGIGMAGATTTAMIFIPLLAPIVLISYMVQEKNGIREILLSWKLGITYFATLIPIVIMALKFREYAKNNLHAGAALNSGFPSSFYGQLGLMINPLFPITAIVLVVAALLVASHSQFRKFFLTWIFLGVALLLNPFVAPLIIKHITSENIYWRLFYILPFPLIIVISGAIVFHKSYTPRNRPIFMMIIGLIFIASFFGPTSVIRKDNGATFEWPRYKIPLDAYMPSKEILTKSPEGPMLSPLEISSAVLLLSSKHPQICMRDDYMRLIFESNHLADEYLQRNKVFQYLYSGANQNSDKKQMANLLDSQNRPVSVVLLTKGIQNNEVIEMLISKGYDRRELANKEYQLFVSALH